MRGVHVGQIGNGPIDDDARDPSQQMRLYGTRDFDPPTGLIFFFFFIVDERRGGFPQFAARLSCARRSVEGRA